MPSKSISGAEILRRIGRFENRCQRETEKRLPRMGKNAPKCYEHLAQILAYADMIGSCTFGCPDKSSVEAHAVPYLAARASSFGRASLRLAKMGFYDEALALVRSIGEMANLLALFVAVPKVVEEWKKSDTLYRVEKLSPGKIRKRLRELGREPIVDDKVYWKLCEVSTHPVPELRPQQFNHAGRPIVGGVIFEAPGFLVVLNELAWPISFLTVFLAKICKVPEEKLKDIRESCIKCAASVGRINITTVREMLEGRLTGVS